MVQLGRHIKFYLELSSQMHHRSIELPVISRGEMQE